MNSSNAEVSSTTTSESPVVVDLTINPLPAGMGNLANLVSPQALSLLAAELSSLVGSVGAAATQVRGVTKLMR